VRELGQPRVGVTTGGGTVFAPVTRVMPRFCVVLIGVLIGCETASVSTSVQGLGLDGNDPVRDAVRAECTGAYDSSGGCVACVAHALNDLGVTGFEHGAIVSEFARGECRDRCVATTCAIEGVTCGELDDGCGTTLDCGSCGVTFTASFPPLDHAADFDAFQAALSGSTVYHEITFSSDTDPGYTCTGPEANTLCQAIRTQPHDDCLFRAGSYVSVACGGNTWSVGACGGTEITVNSPLCSCVAQTALRAEIGDACHRDDPVWGGVNTEYTCTSPPATLTLRCR
jgi:hypothetical protein